VGHSTCPELNLDDWGGALLKQLKGGRYPLSATFDLTERCNLACVHCYIRQPATSWATRTQELTTAQVAGLLDKMADAGCLFVTLTGGEVLLRPDFAEIYGHARQRGLLVNVFTNATLLTPRIADLLATSRPLAVDVTLYGATAETYERVTGVPGSYGRCWRGIRLALDRGLPLHLKAVVLTTNRHELPAMRTQAEELDVKFRYDGLVWPRLDGGQQPLDYRLSVEEVVGLDCEDPERQQAWADQARLCEGHLIRAEYVYSCGAGFRSFHVDSGGRLSVCAMSRRPAYDLLQGSFQDGWEALRAVTKEKRQLDTACRTCRVGPLCVQCPGWSRAVHDDDETPVEFVCALGRLRAARVNVPISGIIGGGNHEQEAV
jgi:radical SAM protein with 4Fe4S-binding SPASM domain